MEMLQLLLSDLCSGEQSCNRILNPEQGQYWHGQFVDAASGNTFETLDPEAGNMEVKDPLPPVSSIQEELSENRAYLSPPMQAQTHIQALFGFKILKLCTPSFSDLNHLVSAAMVWMT
ncbi:hypothetical protein PVL29_015425 [Vitis rotundifolia]|uniref:Uncharacterized protein n=1 Tax=Vitis rotundifolia TaxID=103349 RepID=A0AA38ZDD9_VITRO|nr:hypothetical protein PVL29_015422 [Vitis rotundifolia]KAJ9686517.1 hypothetical protein PVL29_015425 [Vitis rotundifolia]